MRKVTRTKKPSAKQALNMAVNLCRKKRKCVVIHIESHAYSTGSAVTDFWFSVDGGIGMVLKSWEGVLDKYFELMDEEG